MNGTVGLGRSARLDRSRARAWTLQIHYRWESTGSEGTLRDAFVETLTSRKIAHRRMPYIRWLVDLLDAHLPEIDAAIGAALQNWRFERLSAIDRAVLRIATAERSEERRVGKGGTARE